MKKIKRYGLGGCAGGLAILLLAIFACPGFSFVGAQETPATDATSAATKIYAKSTISISPLQEFNLAITPESSGATFANGKVEVSITTNNRSGYGLYLHTTSAEGKLRNRDSGVADTINPMMQAATPTSSTFASNTWGYSKNGMDYQAVPTSSTEIIKTDTASTNTKHEVYIGAKIDTNLAAGEYRGDVVLSAVANPVTVATLADLVYMQEMTPVVCKNTEEIGKTFVLRDKRNNTDYNVAKLKDNNCWMQQDLALNLGISATPNDTDISTSRTLSGSWWHPNSYWYYSWGAATAGSGASATTEGAEAKDSICPKGWQLPLSGANNDNISGSFYNLVTNKYGITDYGSMVSIGCVAPLSFSRASIISSGSIVSEYYGRYGAYWSRTASSNSSAYEFAFWSVYSTTFMTSYAYDPSIGQTVRCLARQVAR